ncbi:uncharacterized protein CC84DRAFT_961788 [Paraphaeosphaeria sporulosa]|uniref:Uncharacterized protein n=1 Tax=Paraphaeosphaeria sporulosa TaxID=1460663 RepID=A0A177C8U3_9PLEO|nr:uncharacterized protein CC84DRAFT_961788 [Paraphaeosphaeria sporulosa]OAG03177.1 hypothetical protein CC84DRAFT_961788 [Paraphaeosphaeria sporulosa]
MVAFQPSADTSPGLGCPSQPIDAKPAIIEPDPFARWRARKSPSPCVGLCDLSSTPGLRCQTSYADAMHFLRLINTALIPEALAICMHHRDDSDTFRSNPTHPPGHCDGDPQCEVQCSRGCLRKGAACDPHPLRYQAHPTHPHHVSVEDAMLQHSQLGSMFVCGCGTVKRAPASSHHETRE